MEPTYKTELVGYWTCCNQQHRHQTERAAKACITRDANKESKKNELKALAMRLEDPMDALSVRASNCLKVEGIFTIDDLRAASKEGRLSRIVRFGPAQKMEALALLECFPLNTEVDRTSGSGRT